MTRDTLVQINEAAREIEMSEERLLRLGVNLGETYLGTALQRLRSISAAFTVAQGSRYRKRLVVVEARRFAGDHAQRQAVVAWVIANELNNGEPSGNLIADWTGGSLWIPTPEGKAEARPGDWIVKGARGEFYPVKPDIFEAEYEPE